MTPAPPGLRAAAAACASLAGCGAGRRPSMSVFICDAGERPCEVGQRPPGLEGDRGVLVHVVEQEDPLAKAGEYLLGLAAVELACRPGRHALEPLQQTFFVALGLESADEPGARVGQAFVVQIDGVLSGQQDADSESPGLLEQCEQRSLGRRFGYRGEEPEDLVHVDDGPQASGPRLRADPAQYLVQQQRDEEHALAVGEMGDGEDGDARPAPCRCRAWLWMSSGSPSNQA